MKIRYSLVALFVVMGMLLAACGAPPPPRRRPQLLSRPRARSSSLPISPLNRPLRRPQG